MRAALSTPTGAPIGLATPGLSPTDRSAVEKSLSELRAIGGAHLRIPLGLADLNDAERPDWEALFDKLRAGAAVLPSIPADAALGRIEALLEGGGGRFEWVELALSPGTAYSPEAAAALQRTVQRLRAAGRRVALAGLPGALQALVALIQSLEVDAVGVRALPGADPGWPGWEALPGMLGSVAAGKPEFWVSELGMDGLEAAPRARIAAVLDTARLPVDRIYLQLNPVRAMRESDPDTLILRTLARGGIDELAKLRRRSRPVPRPVAHTLITGGAGFIGCNLADRILSLGEPVLIYDNLSRPGTEENLRWLCDKHGSNLRFELADVRHRPALRRALRGARRVFHFAAQVAVTSSLDAPVFDQRVNAAGTLHLLEALRELNRPVPLVFTSTNKVYGGLQDIALHAADYGYAPDDPQVARHGIDESWPLEFRSPYGCSKGAADQYVLDYSETFGLPATVLRMSCIYGPHQFGNEDQGWVAHFVRRALSRQPITIYGDGLQVRDVLFVDDLIDALLLSAECMGATAGEAFNIGGGPGNVLSLLELLNLLERLRGETPPRTFETWRPSDQRYYVSDVRKFARATGWQPRVGVEEGVGRLLAWMEQQEGGVGTSPRLAKGEVGA